MNKTANKTIPDKVITSQNIASTGQHQQNDISAAVTNSSLSEESHTPSQPTQSTPKCVVNQISKKRVRTIKNFALIT